MHEIDFILANENGDIVGIEIKSGMTVSKSDFKHLSWFKDKLAKNHKMQCIILYTGKDILSFGNDFIAIPITNMWN